MHILIIPSEEYLPANNHLAGIFQQHQAMALCRAGCRVGIISVKQRHSVPMLLRNFILSIFGKVVHPEFEKYSTLQILQLLYNKCFAGYKFITEEIINDIRVIRAEGFYFFPPSKHTNHFGWLAAGRNAYQHYVSIYGKPDIVHAHNAVYAGLLARSIQHKWGIPFCVTEHSSYVARGLESRGISRRIRKAYKKAAAFFVVSQFLGEAISQQFRSHFNWKVIPNVLDREMESNNVPLSDHPVVFRFFAIGDLIPLKRHQDIIAAFKQAFPDQMNIQLTIAGDGPLFDVLAHQIKETKLANIFLAGKLNRQDILTLIDQSHCLVHASEFETFGVVLIEALSRGKPVISSKCGGPQSIITAENGYLFDTADINGLAMAMKKMVSNYSQFNQQKIRNLALQQYGTISVSQQLIDEYRIILQAEKGN